MRFTGIVRTAGWLVVGLLIVTACGGEESTDTSSPSTSTSPATSTTVETTTVVSTEPAPTTSSSIEPRGGEDIVITFSVEGGFAGLSRRLEIRNDGSATVDSNGAVSTGEVDPAELERLTELLEASGLFDEDAIFEADGADLQRYEIHFADATIVAFDGSIPPSLGEAIDDLQQLTTTLLTS